MILKDKIRTLRVASGMSQETMAEQLSVSRQAVAKWELGQSVPEVETLVTLSRMFQVSLDRLLKDENDCLGPLRPGDAAGGGDSLVEEEDKRHGVQGFCTFLLRAKAATYAGKGPETESSRPSSHDLEYRQGPLLYVDTFLGGMAFAGEEAVWLDRTPLWSMNYLGRVTGEGFSGDFLKEALKSGVPSRPYRGPEYFSRGEYTYISQVSGTMDWFEGREFIYVRGTEVYQCLFHGGRIV